MGVVLDSPVVPRDPGVGFMSQRPPANPGLASPILVLAGWFFGSMGLISGSHPMSSAGKREGSSRGT
ncbi:hypothetical protein C5167_018072 [Papaver somniferum]|uniref:Uncharacterized protein n=1 Tax=Papaver somniferum TaxID=3469 RepID=A0A4Y7IPA5_PAPSO|nr:hypothetical protein C5167_018072 [Papaver somniferum]